MRQTFQELIEPNEMFLARKMEGKRQWGIGHQTQKL
jgi:hypothetical protein